MELKANEVVIFKNTKKEEGSKQPDYKGSIDVDGTPYDIALWIRESKDGKKYFSGKVSEPYKKETPANQIDDIDEGLPF